MPFSAQPYFAHGIGNMLMDPGQSVHWRCKAVARPPGTYTWYKNGQLLKTVPGEIEVRGHMLYILAVEKDRDEGMYQCGATNLHGTTFSTGRLKVVCKSLCVSNELYHVKRIEMTLYLCEFI